MKQHGGNVYAFSKQNNISLDQVIDFSANINPLGMSLNIEPALKNILKDALNYPDPFYTRLREGISLFESVKASHIVMGNGAIECIFLLAEALKSKHVMIQAPTFIEYERAFSKFGATIHYDDLPHGDFASTLDIERLPDMIDTIVICNPNNPTGYLMDRVTLLNTIEKAYKKGVRVIIDEAFIDFTDEESENTLVPYLDRYDNLFILKSLTKFFAMPGLRLGYLLTSNQKIIAAINETRIPWSINIMAETIGMISISDSAYIKKTKDFMINERKWLMAHLTEIPFLKVYQSQGNYLFFYSEVHDLHTYVKRYKMMIRDCGNYENLGPGFYRVAIKSRLQNLELLKCLKEYPWKL